MHVFTYLWIPPAHSLEKEPASIPERACRAERCFGKYGPRVLGLLGCVGAVKSAKYVGTRVLPLEKATENSDFTNPVFRRRLVDMMESFQILRCHAERRVCSHFPLLMPMPLNLSGEN